MRRASARVHRLQGATHGVVAPVFPLFEIFRFFANAGAALRLARGKSRARHELTGDEEPREADGAANGDEDWIHLRARANAFGQSIVSFILGSPRHGRVATERRNDVSAVGTNERNLPRAHACPYLSRRTDDRRAFVRRSRRTLLLDPFTREDATNDGRRTTTHLWAKPTLSERHVESKRVCVLWRVSRDARPVVPRAGTTDAFVCSSPRRGREGVHLGSRIGES